MSGGTFSRCPACGKLNIRGAKCVCGQRTHLPVTGDLCGAQYGSNPDRCYQPAGHPGTHSNRYGCTWPQEEETR